MNSECLPATHVPAQMCAHVRPRIVKSRATSRGLAAKAGAGQRQPVICCGAHDAALPTATSTAALHVDGIVLCRIHGNEYRCCRPFGRVHDSTRTQLKAASAVIPTPHGSANHRRGPHRHTSAIDLTTGNIRSGQ